MLQAQTGPTGLRLHLDSNRFTEARMPGILRRSITA